MNKRKDTTSDFAPRNGSHVGVPCSHAQAYANDRFRRGLTFTGVHWNVTIWSAAA